MSEEEKNELLQKEEAIEAKLMLNLEFEILKEDQHLIIAGLTPKLIETCLVNLTGTEVEPFWVTKKWLQERQVKE